MPQQGENATDNVARVPEEGTGQPRRVAWGGLLAKNTFASMRHRNFRLFFTGQLISLVGTWMQNTAQGWLVYQLTGSKVLLGVVVAAGSGPMILFSVLGGSVADRHPKRAIVVATQTVMMLQSLAFAALIGTGKIAVWHILVLAAAGGLAMAFDMPARQSFMVEMTSKDDLMNAISLNSLAVNGARIIGPSLAGLLMVRVGLMQCFLFNGISYLAVIAGLLMMRLPRFVAPERTASAWQHAMEGFRYVWHERRMRILLILFAVVGVFGWSYSVLMPAFAKDVLHVGESGFGMLLSASGVGALFGALTVASAGERTNRRALVLGGLWVFSAMLLLLSVIDNRWLAMAALAVSGWGMLLFFSTTNTLLQTGASDSMRGRVMGIWALVFGGMMPIGGLEAGLISHWFGVRATIASGAVICALAGLVVWLVVRKPPAAKERRA